MSSAMRFRFLVLAAVLSAVSAFGISGSSTLPARFHAATAAPRVASDVCCAYNPKPSKARPKKSKQPKEKVKGPSPTSMIVPEQTFWEGPPSITETVIPGLSLFTVVGVIPFTASLARQAWTKYKITNRRVEVCSGFQGKDIVQVIWREITDMKWLRRFGGAAGDIVFTLQDGSKLEMRSVPEFDRNLAFMMSQVAEDCREASFYPDGPARDYLEKVERGEEPKPELPPLEAASEAATV